MEESKEAPKEEKSTCCCCSTMLGVAVIALAWWKAPWAPVALTILGVIIIVKEMVGNCICKGKVCKT